MFRCELPAQDRVEARGAGPMPTAALACRRLLGAQVECAKQRLPRQGAATRSLTDLSRPAIDWVSLAAGMGVPATRADTCQALAEQLAAALQAEGPRLIQAMLS